MRVISGTLKRRKIPFQNKKFGGADTTPQKVKGALFSIIGEDLHNTTFLDLYACSGQIGIEAISRGAVAVMNEIERRRFAHIQSLVREWHIEKYATVLNQHASNCIRHLHSREMLFDYIFLDPPYTKQEDVHRYSTILSDLGNYPLLKDTGIIIIQHFSVNRMKEREGIFTVTDQRRYGSTALTFYGIA
jgi:16S rRNA (guanine966-N2)-methyltransferase